MSPLTTDPNTVTVPKTARVAEYARQLEAAVRRAGFAPQTGCSPSEPWL
jgi:hypothetical protein